MSGEAGGILIGGAIALIVAPVVITGAAALGLAYGAIKVGGFLGRHALDYAAERKREKELAVGQCSTQLESMYEQMRSIVRDETTAYTRYAEEMGRKFNAIGMELKSVRDAHPSAEELDKKMTASRSIIQSELGERSASVRKNIIESGQKQLSKCVEMIDKSNAEKSGIIQWADRSAAADALQRSAAADMLRDAEASYRVLDSMAKSGRNRAFHDQVGNVRSALERARTMMDQNMYQAAFSNARTVIRESAMLASEHVQDELEMDMLVMELRARAEGLCEEMKAQRYFEFCDETKRNKKKVKVDLNHFSQGKYKQMIVSLQEMISGLDKGESCPNAYKVMRQMEHFDQTVEPEARHIIEYSRKIMKGYYDRLHVLEVVADFMTEQDYKMDWAMPVGGDASQKLVVHFIQKMTGNTVSVTLDNDVESGDIAKMAMEVLTFYGNGRPVTEDEKRELREHLNEALNKAGLSGSLGCQGNVDRPSDQIEMDQKEAVKNMPTRSIV